MKRVLKVIQILLLLAVLLFSSMGLNYVYATDGIASGSCGNSITWSLSSNGILTITGNGAMSGSSCAWADYKDQVKEVVFNGNITSISACAFEYNTNLEKVTLPDSITIIDRRAFAECTNLKTVVFPKNLRTIGTSSFYKCSSLEAVDIPEDVLYVNENAFAECTSLKTAIVRSSIALVGDAEGTFNNTAQIYGYKYSMMTLKADNKIYSQGVETDPYLRAFFGDLSDRPSCYNCAFKKQYRESDLTIWDCFTVENFDKRLDDDKGTTRILIHSKKGIQLFETIKENFMLLEIQPSDIVNGVNEMYNSVTKNIKREEFFIDINNLNEKDFFPKYFPNNLKVKLERIVRKTLAQTGAYKKIKKLAKKVLRKG